MTRKTRIGIIHATRVSMDPIDRAFQELWPEVETANFLDDSLSVDRAAQSQCTTQLDDRIQSLANYAVQAECSAILYACSAFGTAIETVASRLCIPVLKPNEAMFEAALEAGNQIAMLYTFKPACESMEIEFQEEASSRNCNARLTSFFVADAIEHLRAGDTTSHNRLIAETASKLHGFDALILAHFSMSRAVREVRAATNTRVLTSPDTAVVKLNKLKNQIGGQTCC